VPATGFKLSAHVLTERRLQVRQTHEVIGLADAHNLAANIKAGSPEPGNGGADETPCAGSRYGVRR
jgi:hypothetical protein